MVVAVVGCVDGEVVCEEGFEGEVVEEALYGFRGGEPLLAPWWRCCLRFR